MEDNNTLSRRSSLKSMGVMGAAAILGAQTATGSPVASPAVGENVATSDVRKQIAERVWNTSFVDTHEHLVEEALRLSPETMPFIQCHRPAGRRLGLEASPTHAHPEKAWRHPSTRHSSMVG